MESFWCWPSCVIDSAGLVLQCIGGLGALVIFIIGLRRYNQEMLWKRNEFVAAEIKEFNENLHVRNALSMLDWKARLIELYPGREKYEERFVRVSHAKLVRALRSHRDDGVFDADEVMIRDTFDIFLGYLDRFENFMEAKLVTREQFLPYLVYWTDLIELDLAEDVHKALHHYIEEYEFTGVAKLITRFAPERGASAPRPPKRETFEEQAEN